MLKIRVLPVIFVTVLAMLGASGAARGEDTTAASPAKPQASTGQIERLRSQLTPNNQGLKPQSRSTDGIELPYGINYSHEARTFLVPIDPKNEWGVGLNLNLNAPSAVEMAPPSALGLQPKRTPGLTLQLQRRF